VGDRLRPLWDFDDLDGSERRLEDQLRRETSADGRVEVLTQLARVQGLRDRFEEGERLIAEAERLDGRGAAARARIQLERGRLRRSSGEVASSLPLFEAAFEIARAAGEEFLAADAAHMAALAATERPAKLAWTEAGVRIANASADRHVQYWLGPLYNNLGCEYMDAGEFGAALEAFQFALASRQRFPEMPALIQHAEEAVKEAMDALDREGDDGRL
jgi:tetratricopeptide (TPR) repeat protein